MGEPMAERLLGAGHQLTVFNRTREKALPLAEKGATVAASAREAVAASDVAVVMLRDAGAIRSLLEENGSLPDLSGKTIVQMSTIAPSESIDLAEAVRRAGGEYLEAPVLGSTPQAREGKLLVLVGGSQESFDRWVDLLRAFGPEPVRIGDVGRAAALKLALNQLIPSLAATFSLSLGMVRRHGIDVEVFMNILRQSTFFAPSFDRKLPQMLARDFANTNFPAELMLKDLHLIRAEATALGLDPQGLDGVLGVVQKTVDEGHGREDYSALYQVVDPASAPD
jgi:3-hydroxyisobutyrate dehydrogenase-like beta-hydroxyacid dehydrogenase